MRDIEPKLLDDLTAAPALEWAQEWSDETEARLDSSALRERIRAALDADDRIPFVTRRGEHLYNFWRDGDHQRGLWRRVTVDAYLADQDDWETLLDIDALAEEEGKDWVYKGATVLPLSWDRALIRLSRGGADAVVVREFDLETQTFVDASDGGFALDEAKTSVDWVDRDTILVGTDEGPGTVTNSGYPMQVARWTRGGERTVIFTGEPDDVGVWSGYDVVDRRTVVTRALDFYTSRTWVDGEFVDVPDDCDAIPHRKWLFIQPRTEFAGVPAGALGVIELDAFQQGGREFTVLEQDATVEAIAFTENALLLTCLVDVATSISRITLGTWERTELALPAAASAHVVAASPLAGDEFWVAASSFTTPTTLLRGDATGALAEAKRAPAHFDASGLETRQHWVTSADGTRLPYFITGDFSLGARPTLVGGYGGFEVSLTPAFSNVRGIAWLEQGNFYVQPNLRGGGEFGPEWHSQVVKTNRHKVWEDHKAVLEDVVARGYAEPAQIAIRGGSNGGLLTSGALVQYPECFGAAVIQVPLTDMLRYHTLSAGASWMAEYGDPDNVDERAAIETWSPLHNVRPRDEVAYPPALVTTSTRDDRVHPAHARTFALALWRAGQPVDYFENTAGGHAGAADNAQVSRVEALIYQWIDDKIGKPLA
ncbi:prolyl oligopeptidase family protein [Corynebacterium sp. HMSC05H05]|uniref:prolyl oligopeptidase family serine peptidase n=1 Tax=Corynebacterium sp. HMSC05H05 TaxID=1581119 RepID=UPI0009F2FE77|nr:prolyl oligopeptidase family serine peptidase [Corynebacterium sp. HMSC05H05]